MASIEMGLGRLNEAGPRQGTLGGFALSRDAAEQASQAQAQARAQAVWVVMVAVLCCAGPGQLQEILQTCRGASSITSGEGRQRANAKWLVDASLGCNRGRIGPVEHGASSVERRRRTSVFADAIRSGQSTSPEDSVLDDL
jgi:hypothetical protein